MYTKRNRKNTQMYVYEIFLRSAIEFENALHYIYE